MSRRRPVSHVAPGPGLALHEAAARAEALLRERERLLREVRKKKTQLERLEQQLASDAATTTARMTPVIRRHDALVEALTTLFAELLGPGRASVRARKPLVKLRWLLELRGVLTADATAQDADPAREPRAGSEARARASRERKRERASPHQAPPGAAEVSGAEQVGQQRRSLRELFRSLVKAVHPDQARHETEREHRTQVMKQVTRAYEDGDLARLVELESAWQRERAAAADGDALTRCRALERINRELLDQIRSLTREIRDLKRQALDSSLGLTPDELCARASRELDELEDICRFVESFRDGKLSVAELERGPASLGGFEQIDSLDQLLSAFIDEATAPSRGPRRRRRSA